MEELFEKLLTLIKQKSHLKERLYFAKTLQGAKDLFIMACCTVCFEALERHGYYGRLTDEIVWGFYERAEVMSFRTELAEIALQQINLQTLVLFEEMTEEIDLFETAVAEYDGVILQLLFPNPVAECPKFQTTKNRHWSTRTDQLF